MARPKKIRRVCGQVAYACFKPNGVKLSELNTVDLLPEELEALRLADKEGLSQLQAATQMGISRQTFGNIVNQARAKVATCLVEGHALMLVER
ncbi:DUF134 domain-containing protein [Vibrio anguillarum]|uniref:DUF134 domain-containing protein n=1 Tax=Vibrio TaxID=662 RepID=UPI0006475EAB|nr:MULTISPECIES: DUF134 domain-containing protein [Vibrio]AQM19665.1 hypothetical protein PN51_07720 [Vibrio anguillarum]AUB88070.1 DUF134 domain-containing protein [Vibrio anguillarum]AUB91512.1 DUF134 domain-containing protein [Vibrio anguillarum]AUB94949.1 DUF134 domain-containing protein [Vibrio anguillarum]AUB98366.1 DUF134 domain-containing protein [Vibrio anguillarum]